MHLGVGRLRLPHMPIADPNDSWRDRRLWSSQALSSHAGAVEIIARSVLGLLLVAHGLVHLPWLAPRDDPALPFRLDRFLF